MEMPEKLYINLTEKLGQSLSLSYIQDAAVDIAENMVDSSGIKNVFFENWNMDCFVNNQFLRNAPVVKSLLGIAQIGYNVYSYNLLNQTGCLLDEFEKCKSNLNDLSEKSKKHFMKCLKDYKSMEKELGRVLILINRNVDTEKTRFQARFLYKFYTGEITKDEFHELCEITGRLFLGDLETLKSIYEGAPVTDRDLSYRHE